MLDTGIDVSSGGHIFYIYNAWTLLFFEQMWVLPLPIE